MVEKIKFKVSEVESSNYVKGNLWHLKYVDDIIDHYNRVTPGSIVFISTHPVVINELARRGFPVMIVTPNHKSAESHISALKLRMNASGLEKDKRAYEMAEANYEADILNITRRGYANAIPYELKEGNYLLDEIENIKEVYKKYNSIDI